MSPEAPVISFPFLGPLQCTSTHIEHDYFHHSTRNGAITVAAFSSAAHALNHISNADMSSSDDSENTPLIKLNSELEGNVSETGRSLVDAPGAPVESVRTLPLHPSRRYI